ncbi:hypothetical protein ACJJTC_002525, partial [Scirpophaga incertulas]
CIWRGKAKPTAPAASLSAAARARGAGVEVRPCPSRPMDGLLFLFLYTWQFCKFERDHCIRCCYCRPCLPRRYTVTQVLLLAALLQTQEIPVQTIQCRICRVRVFLAQYFLNSQCRRSIVSPPPPPSRGVNVEPSEVELCAEWGTAHTSTRLLLFCSTRTSLHAMLHPPTTFTAHGLHLAAAIVGCIWRGKAKPTAPAASLSAAARARGAGVEVRPCPSRPMDGLLFLFLYTWQFCKFERDHCIRCCYCRPCLPRRYTVTQVLLLAALLQTQEIPVQTIQCRICRVRVFLAQYFLNSQCRRSIVSPPPPPSRGVNVEPSEVELCAEWGTAHTSTRLLLFCSTRTSLHAMLHPPTTFTAHGLHLAAAIVGCIWRGKAKPTAPAASLSAAARARGAGVEVRPCPSRPMDGLLFLFLYTWQFCKFERDHCIRCCYCRPCLPRRYTVTQVLLLAALLQTQEIPVQTIQCRICRVRVFLAQYFLNSMLVYLAWEGEAYGSCGLTVCGCACAGSWCGGAGSR